MLDEKIKENVKYHVRQIEIALGKIEQGVDVTDRIIGDAKDIAELFDQVEKKTTLSSVIRRLAKHTI
jgi:alpha-D-ribose 1-methylphosphonate 5-phosphate C-P lyase